MSTQTRPLTETMPWVYLPMEEAASLESTPRSYIMQMGCPNGKVYQALVARNDLDKEQLTWLLRLACGWHYGSEDGYGLGQALADVTLAIARYLEAGGEGLHEWWAQDVINAISHYETDERVFATLAGANLKESQWETIAERAFKNSYGRMSGKILLTGVKAKSRVALNYYLNSLIKPKDWRLVIKEEQVAQIAKTQEMLSKVDDSTLLVMCELAPNFQGNLEQLFLVAKEIRA